MTTKPDHKAAMESAKLLVERNISLNTNINTNIAACYLDLTERHKKLLELAEANLKCSVGSHAALRAFIEEERKRT